MMHVERLAAVYRYSDRSACMI